MSMPRDAGELETEVRFNLICRRGKTAPERRRYVNSVFGRLPKTIAVVDTHISMVTPDGARLVARITVTRDEPFELRRHYDAIARYLMQQPDLTVSGRNCNVREMYADEENT